MCWLLKVLPLALCVIYTAYFMGLWIYLAMHPEWIVKFVAEMACMPRIFITNALSQMFEQAWKEMTGFK